MCEPVTLTLMAMAMTAASTGASLYASDTQAKQEQSNLNYQAAQTAADAKAAQGEAQVEAMRIRKQADTQRKQAASAAAASGIDITSPTSLKIDQKIQATGEEDAITTLLNGSDTSSRMNNQAAVDRTGASLAISNAHTAAVGTLLSSAGSLANTAAHTNWKKAA